MMFAEQGYPSFDRISSANEPTGPRVPDPYRKLENSGDPIVTAWIADQQARARTWFSRRSASILNDLKSADNGFQAVPVVRGRRYFQLRRCRGEPNASLVVIEGGQKRTLIAGGTGFPIEAIAISHDGRRVMYQRANTGNELRHLYVLSVDDGTLLETPSSVGRAATTAWMPDGDSIVLSGESGQGERGVWLHSIGRDRADDLLIHRSTQDSDNEHHRLQVFADDHGAFLLISTSVASTPGVSLRLARIDGGLLCRLQPIGPCRRARMAAHIRRGRVYLVSNDEALNGQLLTAPADRPDRLRTLIPEQESVLDGIAVMESMLLVSWRAHGSSSVTAHDPETGNVRETLELPRCGSITISSALDQDLAWITHTDFDSPLAIYEYRPNTGLRPYVDECGPRNVPSSTPKNSSIAVERLWYPAADGVKIPISVIHGSNANAANVRPTILYTYGGFGVSVIPSFSLAVKAWVEAGGVYAVAHIRGGGELGTYWHDAGRRAYKSRAIDDFVAAAQWLVSNGWTAPSHLGVTGSSNGGLIVAAAMVRRPELFTSVICSAAPLDMVRYEHSGLGASWRDEYGSADVPEELAWLLSYSPYHHVRHGVRYPAVLLQTFADDVRVDPSHSRKFAAALQWATVAPVAERPIVHRVVAGLGHGVCATGRTIERMADTLAWHGAHLGLRVPPG